MSREVVVETPTDRRSGQALDLAAEASTLAAAVRGEAETVTVRCPEPQPVHDHVGVVGPDRSVRVRTALSAAARSRGLTAPQDEDLAAVREELADLSVEEVDTAEARRRLAGTESEVSRLRERVATVRGRLQAAREAGRDTADLRAELADATRALSEAETERAAAQEALNRVERRAREARDARERRRRLRDRAANLERAARRHLVDALREEYAAAVVDAPGPPVDDPFEADAVTAALGVARVADLRAPVVLACGRFADARAAADWLDAAVLRATPDLNGRPGPEPP